MKSMREMINLMESVSAVPGLNLNSTNIQVDEQEVGLDYWKRRFNELCREMEPDEAASRVEDEMIRGGIERRHAGILSGELMRGLPEGSSTFVPGRSSLKGDETGGQDLEYVIERIIEKSKKGMIAVDSDEHYELSAKYNEIKEEIEEQGGKATEEQKRKLRACQIIFSAFRTRDPQRIAEAGIQARKFINYGTMYEKAPPGREKQVKALKKEFPGDEERAFATAWASYNKSHGKKDEAVAGVGPGYVEEGSFDHDMSPRISVQDILDGEDPTGKIVYDTSQGRIKVLRIVEVDAMGNPAELEVQTEDGRKGIIQFDELEGYEPDRDLDEEINGIPDTELCKQSNPASCRDACHMEENMMYQMEESSGKVQEIMNQLQQLDGLYAKEEIFDMIASRLAAEGYAEDEINELFHAVDMELGIGNDNHDMDDYIDEPEYDEPMGSDDMSDDADALASAGHGSDEDYGSASDMYEDDFPMEEAFDLNNGYDDVHNANPQNYFPTGADSPVVGSVGNSSRQGDNPEQKRVAVDEEVSNVHKELVYSYRNYLKESAPKKKD